MSYVVELGTVTVAEAAIVGAMSINWTGPKLSRVGLMTDQAGAKVKDLGIDGSPLGQYPKGQNVMLQDLGSYKGARSSFQPLPIGDLVYNSTVTGEVTLAAAAGTGGVTVTVYGVIG